jgi:hypothetical protein
VIQDERQRGDLLVAMLAGLLAAALSAGVWAVIAVLTNHAYGIVAVFLGALCGYAVRWGGRGSSLQFGVVGAVCALLGIAAGNVLAVAVFIAQELHLPLLTVLSKVDFQLVWEVLTEDFTVLDGLFYAFAVYEGFRFAILPGTAATAPAPQAPVA